VKSSIDLFPNHHLHLAPMAYQNDNSEYLHLQSRLRREYVGVSLSDVPTPAFIVDRKIFAENCAKMQKKAREWGTEFRAHVKTHKVGRISVS